MLLIDDDVAFCETIQSYLVSNGLDVRVAHNANEARVAVMEQPFDIFLLDLILPGTSGKVLCREFVETSDAGIIVVSVMESDEERINLLEMGADDYLVKPFSERELLARIRAYFRRGRRVNNWRKLEFGSWRLASSSRILRNRDGKVVTLTPSEARVMRLFAENPGLVFERGEILAVSRMRQYAGANDRSVDNLIKRIRRKIEDNPSEPQILETVWGKGYVLRGTTGDW